MSWHQAAPIAGKHIGREHEAQDDVDGDSRRKGDQRLLPGGRKIVEAGGRTVAAALMTLLMPGAGPPPTRMATFSG